MSHCPQHYDALSLFSGGLDSILAHRTVMDQGLKVLGIHFVSPFFGKPELIPFWQKEYGAAVQAVDISGQFCGMLVSDPALSFGKQLNPCIDCKILMLKQVKNMLPKYGASFLISGEVVGQRPMSQRPDALNLINKSAGVSDILLRPLCALKLEPTPVELAGLVDRSCLRDLYGRNRKPQLAIARHEYGFSQIPTPGGGCLLGEIKAAAYFWYLLQAHELADTKPEPEDFLLAQAGRQFWAKVQQQEKISQLWLCIGRNQEDNARLENLQQDGDISFKVLDFPAPFALSRPLGVRWTSEWLQEAACLLASYAPKAVKAGGEVRVLVQNKDAEELLRVMPKRETAFAEPNQNGFRAWKTARTVRA